jgi:hypothetical protein
VIAALFVATNGCYFGLPDVEPWDVTLDAKTFRGTMPVVAHPPCERWGRYWHGGPSARTRRKLGDDDGCFEFALWAVRRNGGVLEHPEASHAFAHFGLRRPRWQEGWARDDYHDAWVCCVAQRHYGHRGRKLTWLYAVGTDLPALDWSIPDPSCRLDYGFHSAAERRARRDEVVPWVNASRLTAAENLATPLAFRDVLLGMARSVPRCTVAPTASG